MNYTNRLSFCDKYLLGKGRSSRKGFWTFILFWALVGAPIITFVYMKVIDSPSLKNAFLYFSCFAISWMTFSMVIRRLHGMFEVESVRRDDLQERLQRIEDERNEMNALREQFSSQYDSMLAKFADADNLYDTDQMSALGIAKTVWDEYLQYISASRELVWNRKLVGYKTLPAGIITRWASRADKASQIVDWKYLAVEANQCDASYNYNYLNKSKEELALKTKSYKDVCKALNWYIGADGDLCLCEDLMRFLCDAFALNIDPVKRLELRRCAQSAFHRSRLVCG